MLNIHERRECGIPVIIKGETGVGKTALINMLSTLWNHALISEWREVKERIIEMLCPKSLGMYRVAGYVYMYINQCLSLITLWMETSVESNYIVNLDGYHTCIINSPSNCIHTYIKRF